MLKTILNLKGTQQLSKKDQQSIKGSRPSELICCTFNDDLTVCLDWFNPKIPCAFSD